jgi:hypothetical protein
MPQAKIIDYDRDGVLKAMHLETQIELYWHHGEDIGLSHLCTITRNDCDDLDALYQSDESLRYWSWLAQYARHCPYLLDSQAVCRRLIWKTSAKYDRRYIAV